MDLRCHRDAAGLHLSTFGKGNEGAGSGNKQAYDLLLDSKTPPLFLFPIMSGITACHFSTQGILALAGVVLGPNLAFQIM